MRPACALLQAAFGGTVANFDTMQMGEWITFPTPDMRTFIVTEKDIEDLKKYDALRRGKK